MDSRTIIKCLVLACSIVLTACSSDDDPAPTTPTPISTTTISGVAEAPLGVVAQFELDKPFLLAATDLLIPSAHADIIGLDPVGGATVELIRIDDDGNQVGDVLASTVTSITGNYDLALPEGVSLAGNLVVRITGNSGTSMSAMVVELAVDINPISEYVLSKFVDDASLVLGDLALNEVVSLQDKVEAFDLTATADLSSMLAQLDAELGELVDTEIAVLTSTPDDGTAVAALSGTWNSIEFQVGMSDWDTLFNVGTLQLDTLSDGMAIAAGANAGEVDFSFGLSTLIDAWTDYIVTDPGIVNISHGTSLTSDSGDLVGLIDNDGNIVLELPFEEDLESVNLQQDPDGPDYGWRFPPASLAINNTGNDNTLVFVQSDVGVRYETIDTNNDGVKDAINPDAKVGDEASIGLGLLLKQGSGMDESSLDGDYGLVSTTVDLTTTPPVGSVDSTVGVITFDSATTPNPTASATLEKVGFTRSGASLTNIILTDIPPTTEVASIEYTVSEIGLVTLDPGVDPLQGWTNDDGSVIGLLNVDSVLDSISFQITAVTHEIMVAVKLPATTPAMGNAVFKLYPVAYGADENGMTEMVSLRSISSLTFNAGATEATADFTSRGYQRATDIDQVEALVDSDDALFNYAVTMDANGVTGAIDMNFSDSSLEGFISADGSMMVLRIIESDDTAGEKFRANGMVIGIRQ